MGAAAAECLALRIQDVDCSRKTLMIRNGKGKKDRLCTLPQTVMARLQEHIRAVKATHEQDLARGLGRVVLPDALHRKFPCASGEFRWQFLFPQKGLFKNPVSEHGAAQGTQEAEARQGRMSDALHFNLHMTIVS